MLDFGIVYRIDDLDSGRFYIGETTREKKWNDGYLGTGSAKWQNHLKKYPDINKQPNNPNAHHYKRTILHKNITEESILYELELEEIKKYSKFEDGKYHISDPNCMNIKVGRQSEVVESKEICKKCNGKKGKHKSWCPDYVIPDIEICEECGNPTFAHKSDCSHRTHKSCEFCGNKTCHKPWCPNFKGSKRRDLRPEDVLYVCLECLEINGEHTTHCSHYVPPKKICPKCKGEDGHHKKGCEDYKPSGVCPDCNKPLGRHEEWCPNYSEYNFTVEKTCIFCEDTYISKGTASLMCKNRQHYFKCNTCGELIEFSKVTDLKNFISNYNRFEMIENTNERCIISFEDQYKCPECRKINCVICEDLFTPKNRSHKMCGKKHLTTEGKLITKPGKIISSDFKVISNTDSECIIEIL